MKFGTKIGNKGTFKQAGATLLEAISFLAVSAVVIIGAVSLVTSSFSSSDVNQHTTEITSLRTSIKGFFSGQGDYTTATNANIIAAGLVPTTMKITGTTISNAFGGTVTVTGTAADFSIVSTNMKKDVCVKLVPTMNGFLGVKIGSGTEITTLPVTPAQAVTGCSGATNTVTFRAN